MSITPPEKKGHYYGDETVKTIDSDLAWQYVCSR
jgi:hypothetical protein